MSAVKKFSDEAKAEAIRLVEEGVPRKEAAARIGCSDITLRDWLTSHRLDMARSVSDEELLALPAAQWKMFTPWEQIKWIYEVIERGLDLHDFPLVATLKRQQVGSSDPWFHAEWAILLVNFGGKTRKEMAQRLGIHPSTLSAWMKERNQYGKLLHPEQYHYW
ncbi:hypothetical protein C1Y63_01150 [Corynebacterium sp. 13CS0277]|uniref:transposase n=1 Tax=Corynebacterium sp. 13CS0277 TaxID=2071994 RepID=UPI000D02F12E|nr:transposase [Corynebacterium sp. 13CS0277]PRQ12427.1 hypothetical protein C1Y63_01150 [Corynebacterium sp. 13CS0277]